MKNKIIKNTILTVTALLCYGSCEKMVEVDFPINQLTTSQVFESTSTAEGALSALYAEMQSFSVIAGGSTGTGGLLGSYADDLDGYDIYSNNASMDLFNNIQNPSNTTVKLVWGNAYRQIYMANAIVEGLEKSSGIGEKDKNRIKGEAIFIRSLIYYYLTEIFGDVPYATSTDYFINQSLSKTPSIEVLQHLSQDLSAVSPLLDMDYRNTERIYINRKTVDLLSSLLYLRLKQWNLAEGLLGGIITSPLYGFPLDLSKTFKKDGKHILWQLKPMYANTATPEASLYNFSSGVPRYYAASENLLAAFSTADQRKAAWLSPVVSGQKTYYKINKYKTITANTDEYSIVFRLQEAYLLMAEALAQQNRVQEAVNYLNAIRHLAGLADISGSISKEDLLEEILAESRREFFSERGIRFLHLKRSGKLDLLHQSKPNWKNYHSLWPIPLSELALNPSLNPQNNGY
ncbi:hypothetical protein J3D55_002384 [Chryseobacterium ginsenosidimutans]|uniref:RagB/SusD family nutrient uptake outer membrane protein n=1 Tax=Chryseobacterium ginsenosidimutans TaxID=687846 RepID=UPI0021671CFE|nr:RagB/SusD family nutrient uptake outer membrane protein [Chryseobacterium ginsenosidimutans]MCS3869468.1 hypothetical protein [Chryseobacterium ginsenosidimutans]